MGWQWHQLDHMQIICTSLQTDNHARQYLTIQRKRILVHGQVTTIFVVSVGLSVRLFVCTEFFSAVFDPISIKLGHMLYDWV